MKKLFASIVTFAIIANAFSVFASTTDIPISGGGTTSGSSLGEVTLFGSIEPVIMSVTLPSSVPFHMTKSKETNKNKVISPVAKVINNSKYDIEISINSVKSDLGTRLVPNLASVGTENIALGLVSGIGQNPATLSENFTIWLNTGITPQAPKLFTNLKALSSKDFVVVGDIGIDTPEDPFSVTPTFIASF